MAASEIVAQVIDRDTPAGTVVTLAAANGDGNFYTNGSGRKFRIRNAGAAEIDLNVAIPFLRDGVASPPKTYTIPNDSNVHEFSPFPAATYGDVVQLTYEAVTSVTVAVVYDEVG